MALPTLAVATPLGFRVWNPRDQVKFRVHKRLTRTCSADRLGGCAEAALAAEAGRGVNPLHKRRTNGRFSKEERLKGRQPPYFGTLTIGGMVWRNSHGRGDRETYSEKAGVALAVAQRAAGALSLE